MKTKSCSAIVSMLALTLTMMLWLEMTTAKTAASNAARLETPTTTPTPSQPTACPAIEVEVVASVNASTVQVGDTFTVHSTSTGFAGLAQTRLFVSYRLASVPELEVIDPLPMIEVLPASGGSSLGSGEFVVRALSPGSIYLHTEVYGDAFFYSVGCNRGTTFKLVQSEPVHVTIEP